MSSELTISARLVEAGVGLPPTWASLWPNGTRRWVTQWPEGEPIDPSVQVDPSDSQTAFGLVMRLDEWERAGDGKSSWAADLLYAVQDHPEYLDHVLTRMAARIERVGMGHAIRRELWPNEEIEAGTLATLARGPWGYVWVFSVGDVVAVFSPSDTKPVRLPGVTNAPAPLRVPALADITDPAHAQRVIYKAVMQ